VFSAAVPPDVHAAIDPRAPHIQVLDPDTLLLTLPSFSVFYEPTMARFVDAQRSVLESHRNWIIDVRRNDGGSDTTFAPLLPWLLDGHLRTQAVEYFVTPANIKAQEDICALTGDPAGCANMLAPIIASMRAAPPGSFALQGERVLVYPVKSEPRRPARVAILTDQPCASSCEQFVLEARTSMRVKVLGRPTGGMLDVSNLRPHALPSTRKLWYATTRSTRLPLMRIDDIGIAPDILLPKPGGETGYAAEVKRVQRWIEGGSIEDK
jgi:C-terminal processing protease CtpA/Prc